jgi:hypothetical protein
VKSIETKTGWFTMKKNVKQAFQVASAIAVITTIALAFQNCSGGFGSSIASFGSHATGIIGSAVKEAGLTGVAVVSHDVKSAGASSVSAAQSGPIALVSCTADKTHCEATQMPVISQRNLPTPLADSFCAPTSSSMIFEAILKTDFAPTAAYTQHHYTKEYMGLSNLSDRVLLVGKHMETTQAGTTSGKQMGGMDWFLGGGDDATYGIAFGDKYRNYNQSPQSLVDHVKSGGVGTLNYTHVVMREEVLASGKTVLRGEALGGHVVALSGFSKNAAGELEIIYNDPFDNVRYSRVFSDHSSLIPAGSDAQYPFLGSVGAKPVILFDWKTQGLPGYKDNTIVVEILTEYLPIIRKVASLPEVTLDPSIPVESIPAPGATPSATPTAMATPKSTATPAPSVSDDVITAWIRQLYNRGLHRDVDSQGLVHWLTMAKSSNTVAQCRALLVTFVSSQEFVALQNQNVRDSDYVPEIYRTVLLREPDANGHLQWVNAIGNGMSRNEMAKQLIAMPETALVCQKIGFK